MVCSYQKLQNSFSEMFSFVTFWSVCSEGGSFFLIVLLEQEVLHCIANRARCQERSNLAWAHLKFCKTCPVPKQLWKRTSSFHNDEINVFGEIIRICFSQKCSVTNLKLLNIRCLKYVIESCSRVCNGSFLDRFFFLKNSLAFEGFCSVNNIPVVYK